MFDNWFTERVEIFKIQKKKGFFIGYANQAGDWESGTLTLDYVLTWKHKIHRSTNTITGANLLKKILKNPF